MAKRGETTELAVLGLLGESPMHGYELRKRLNLMLGWGRVLSYGSLYPTLKKMLRASLIEEEVVTPPPATRRQRIVYRLTDAGRAEFARLMAEVGPHAWEDDSFGVRFAFFSRTDLESRLRVLEGRRTRLEERLARVQGDLDRTRAEADRYASELQRHGVESVEREVRWLSDLITAERNGDPPGPQVPAASPGPVPASRTASTTTTGSTAGDTNAVPGTAGSPDHPMPVTGHREGSE